MGALIALNIFELAGLPGLPHNPTPSPASKFHREMADAAVGKSADKESVMELASAYSVRWGRVANADTNANRAYGADLARDCIKNDIPIRLTDYSTWQVRQQEAKARQAEEERRAADERQRRLRAEEQARRAAELAPAPVSVAVQPAAVVNIDYTGEAKKSARILGCVTQDVRVIGIEGQNILFAAACEAGEPLALSCDKSGLCLKHQP